MSGNRRRIKSVLPSEYASNTSVGEAANMEDNTETTQGEAKRSKAFLMIQQKI